jgi:hypothetical protein
MTMLARSTMRTSTSCDEALPRAARGGPQKTPMSLNQTRREPRLAANSRRKHRRDSKAATLRRIATGQFILQCAQATNGKVGENLRLPRLRFVGLQQEAALLHLLTVEQHPIPAAEVLGLAGLERSFSRLWPASAMAPVYPARGSYRYRLALASLRKVADSTPVFSSSACTIHALRAPPTSKQPRAAAPGGTRWNRRCPVSTPGGPLSRAGLL